MLSADHVYRFDYGDALRTHRDSDAECTIVVTDVDLEEAGEHATVEHAEDGRVTGFAYKPEDPSTGTVATEIFVYDADTLVEVLEDLHREHSTGPDASGSGLGDFGETLVPRFVERGRAVVHALPGYWRDVGQPHHYLAAHLDVLTEDQGLFGDADWPILTRQPPREPARVHAGAVVEDSLLSPGSHVHGEVRRSVVGPGARVASGAVVTDSILFADTVVEESARVHWTIVDERCVVRARAVVGDPAAEGRRGPDQVTILGRDSVVTQDLERGARLEPGTTA